MGRGGWMVTVALACVGVGAALAAGETPAEMPLVAVERGLRAPPATGLLVVAVAPGTQAMEHGIVPGTVLTSYGGVPTGSVEALRGALGKAGTEAVEVSLVAPDGGERTVSLQPGSIGIADMRPVRAGEAVEDLPPDSGLEISFVPLGPLADEWYRFLIDGKHVGFEHGSFSISDAIVSGSREVAFDGGERWGVNHMAAEVEVLWGEHVLPSRTTWTNLRNGWRGEAQAGADAAERRWDVTWHHAEDRIERFAWLLPEGLPIVPTYLVEYVARALPPREGACFRYRPIEEGMGQTGLPSALVVVGEEEIGIDGGTVATWRVEQRRLGGSQAVRYWIDGERRARRIEYGPGVVAELVATRDEAVAGLPESVRPRR